jgi:thiamine pyrophosphate-dependent acetolactate synthase large subunit-like protein
MHSSVKMAAELLQKSSFPVFVVGSQALLIHGKVGELQTALLNIEVPTFLGGMARGLLGPHSDIQVGHY